MRKTLFPAVLLLLFVLSGCIFSPKKDDDDPPGGTQIPPNNTPENTILRFIGLYKSKDIVEYERLFTGDYTFEFSNAADPSLVQKFSTGWFKEDEKIAAQNLFQGGVNSEGIPQPAATNIEVTLANTNPSDDNGSGRDPIVYKVLETAVIVRIDLTSDDTFTIGEAPAQNNRFFLVRGDYAVGLADEQPPDSVHWYIWNWRDESPTGVKPTPPGGDLTTQQESSDSNQSVTWGAVKARYR